jgi:hypothetical protein
MAQAVALVRSHIAPLPAVEIARALIVATCGLALVFAGPALPL